MEPGGLHVAQAALDGMGPGEGGPTPDLEGQLADLDGGEGDLPLGGHHGHHGVHGRGRVVAHDVQGAVEGPGGDPQTGVHQSDLALAQRVAGPRRAGDEPDGMVPGRLGHAQVDRGDRWHGDAEDDLQRPVDPAVGPAGQDLLVADEHVLQLDVVAAGPAHAEGVPGLEDRDAVARRGDRHVQHDPALLGIVVGEHGRHRRPHRGLAGEGLAPTDQKPALDPGGRASRVGQVAAAGRDQDDALVGDPSEGRFRARHVAPVAPRREQDDVVVHD